MEYKSLPQFTKAIDGRTVTGIFAVNGNVDSGGDMSLNGSFAGRLSDSSRKRTRFLWNHRSYDPPIASIRQIREVGRDELPEAVLKYAPDATGGVEVTREYYQGVELSNWVFAGLSAGDIAEMSYAYDVHEFEYMERDGQQIRILKDVELFDVSDVNWGMNPATAAAKGLIPGIGMSFTQHTEAVVSTVQEFFGRVQERADFRSKEGRVLSDANRTRISSLCESLRDVTKQLEELLAVSAPRADTADVLKQVAIYQRTIAQINEVKHGIRNWQY